jgi:hypothetical protein
MQGKWLLVYLLMAMAEAIIGDVQFHSTIKYAWVTV